MPVGLNLLLKFVSIFDHVIYTLKTVSCGMLHVSTAHDRTYIRRHNFMVLIAGSPGEKNIPSLMKQY